MFAFVKSLTTHWQSASPKINADRVLAVVRPAVELFFRLSPLIAVAAIVGVLRGMMQ